jgi:hypothetical protein
VIPTLHLGQQGRARVRGIGALDRFDNSNLVLACSAQKLLSTYTGAAARAAAGVDLAFGDLSSVTIDRLYNQAAAGGQLQQTSAAFRPTWNGNGTVSFTGTGVSDWDYLQTSFSLTASPTISVYMVFTRPDTVARMFWELSANSNAGNSGVRFYGDNSTGNEFGCIASGTTSGAQHGVTVLNSVTTRQCVACTVDRAVGGGTKAKIYVGGALQANNQVIVGGTVSGNFASAPMYVGARSGPALGSASTMVAILVYSNAHSAATVASITTALARLH